VRISTNPRLLAALLGGRTFPGIRNAGAAVQRQYDRDALFLAMLAFAAMLASCILTVDHFVPDSLFYFSVVWRCCVSSDWNAPQRKRNAHTSVSKHAEGALAAPAPH